MKAITVEIPFIRGAVHICIRTAEIMVVHFHPFQLAFKLFGKPHIIMIAKSKELAGRFLNPTISGNGRHPGVLYRFQDYRGSAFRCKEFGRSVRGPIINHDNLLRWSSLIENSLNGFRKEVLSIVGGNND